MFSEISWYSYVTTVAFLLLVYYLFIALRFYRSDVLQIFSGKKFTDDKVSFTATQRSHKENLQGAFEKQDLFQLSQSAANEIQAFLHQAGSDKLNAGEVMNGIHVLLAKYPGLKDSSFGELIENLITSECEMNCAVQLDADQIKALWV